MVNLKGDKVVARLFKWNRKTAQEALEEKRVSFDLIQMPKKWAIFFFLQSLKTSFASKIDLANQGPAAIVAKLGS